MRRVVSVWLPFLATDRLCRGGTPDRSLPLAVMNGDGARRVVAVNRAARRAGVRPGITVADARAVVPGLRVVAADPAADRALLDHLADWCVFFTPWSAVDDWAEGEEGSGAGLWLDITGCAHLLDGEAGLLAELAARLARCGLSHRAAVADTPGAAWAWARFGTAGVLPPDGQRAALAGLPLAALRLDAATVGGLGRLGLKTVGDLYALPRSALAARFGGRLLLRLDQALGRQDEPLSPCLPPVVQRVHLAFAEPIARTEDVAAALRNLLERLAVSLEHQRLGARRLELTAFRADSSRQGLAVGTSRPNRDPRHLFRLLAEPLTRLDCGFGIDLLRLAALEVGPLDSRQTGFDAAGRAPPADSLARLCDTLGNRLGFDRVFRFEPQQSHLPERAARIVPAGEFAVPNKLVIPSDSEGSRRTREILPPCGRQDDKKKCSRQDDNDRRGNGNDGRNGDGHPDGTDAILRRPLRLFPRPEPVEAMAPVPDSPPLLFRWRRHTHRIVRAEGPERLSAEWWRAPAPDRDYYCVEDETGRRFWLYREGLYGEGRAPSWFLHGVFP